MLATEKTSKFSITEPLWLLDSPRKEPLLCEAFQKQSISFIYMEMENFPRYLFFVRGQWRTALMFSLICAWTNG